MERTRTFSWQDPMLGAKAALELTGLEYLRAIERGELPKWWTQQEISTHTRQQLAW